MSSVSDPPRQIYTSVKSRRDIAERPRARRVAFATLAMVSVAMLITVVLSLV